MFFIYRLTDEVHDYYGQTEDIKRRFGEHKSPKCRCRSRLLDKSKMKMHIIHRLYTQEEADETEEFYQLNFDCVNNSVTGRTESEWRLANKEQLSEKEIQKNMSVNVVVNIHTLTNPLMLNLKNTKNISIKNKKMFIFEDGKKFCQRGHEQAVDSLVLTILSITRLTLF